jgi:hypothetical protein
MSISRSGCADSWRLSRADEQPCGVNPLRAAGTFYGETPKDKTVAGQDAIKTIRSREVWGKRVRSSAWFGRETGTDVLMASFFKLVFAT